MLPAVMPRRSVGSRCTARCTNPGRFTPDETDSRRLNLALPWETGLSRLILRSLWGIYTQDAGGSSPSPPTPPFGPRLPGEMGGAAINTIAV